jgi:superfamily I DNA/RNA helicase
MDASPQTAITSTPEEIEEERRLLYVAMTRAKTELDLIVPQRFFIALACRPSHFFCFDFFILQTGSGANRVDPAGGTGRLPSESRLLGVFGNATY